jgi:hypothetical protein
MSIVQQMGSSITRAVCQPDSGGGDGGVPASLKDGLVSWWTLEEASGTRVDSVIATGTDLTDTNTVTQAVGKVGDAAQFVTANDEYLINTTPPASMKGGPFAWTKACWAYHDSSSNQILLSVGTDTSTLAQFQSWLLYVVSNKYRFYTMTPSGNFQYVEATTFGNISTGTWNFVMAWHDWAAGKMYISVNNGTADELDYTTNTPTASAQVPQTFKIGKYGNSPASMDGRVDESAFWDRLLTTDEKAELYNSGAGITYTDIP